MGGRLTLSRWQSAAACIPGSSHRVRDEPGQDSVRLHELDDGRMVLAVADGAGSAPRAEEGSALAVDAAVVAVVGGASLPEAFATARDALGDERHELATTLLVAVVHEDGHVEAAQVGDGFIVVRRRGDLVIACLGPEREFLNETVFLSSDGWATDFRVAEIDDADAVALFSDGLQLVAVELAASKPFAGFFDPLFAWVAGGDACDDELAAFLASPRLAERTDDDLSLALAVLAADDQ